MEIQKIFSNVEDPSENLYSVLMSEEELSLFSEYQKEFNSKAQKALRKAYEIKEGVKALKSKGANDFVSSGFRTIKNPRFNDTKELIRSTRYRDKSHLDKNRITEKLIKETPLQERITNRGLFNNEVKTFRYTSSKKPYYIDEKKTRGHRSHPRDGIVGLRTELSAKDVPNISWGHYIGYRGDYGRY